MKPTGSEKDKYSKPASFIDTWLGTFEEDTIALCFCEGEIQRDEYKDPRLQPKSR